MNTYTVNSRLPGVSIEQFGYPQTSLLNKSIKYSIWPHTL